METNPCILLQMNLQMINIMKGDKKNSKINTKMKPDPPRPYQLQGNSLSSNLSQQNSKTYQKFRMFNAKQKQKQKKREQEKDTNIQFSFLNNLFLHIENNKNQEVKKSKVNFLADNDKQEIPYCLSEPNFASRETILFNPKINDSSIDLKKKSPRIKNLQFTKRKSHSLLKSDNDNKLCAAETNQTFGAARNWKERTEIASFPSKQSSLQLLNIILNESKQKEHQVQKLQKNGKLGIKQRVSIEESIDMKKKLGNKYLHENHNIPFAEGKKICHFCGSFIDAKDKDQIISFGIHIQKLILEVKQIYKQIQIQLLSQKEQISVNLIEMLNAFSMDNVCQRNQARWKLVKKSQREEVERKCISPKKNLACKQQVSLLSQQEISCSNQKGLKDLIEEHNNIDTKQIKASQKQQLKIKIWDEKDSDRNSNHHRRISQYSPRSVGKIVKNLPFRKNFHNFNIPEIQNIKINQLEQRKSLTSVNYSDLQYKSVSNCIKKNLARQKAKRKNSEIFYPLSERNEKKGKANMYEKRKFENCYESMLLALANLKESCNENPKPSPVL